MLQALAKMKGNLGIFLGRWEFTSRTMRLWKVRTEKIKGVYQLSDTQQ